MSMLLNCNHACIILFLSYHNPACLDCLYVCFRVLLADANTLIEMQTRNDSTDPRSSSTFYERYHSLEDVWASSAPTGF